MLRYTNLIWDFDGMLFNTYPRMATAFKRALSEMGVEIAYDDVMASIKRSVGKAADKYSLQYGIDRAALAERYHDIEHSLSLDSIVPYDGMCELLKDAAKAGCRHFLYTHRDNTSIEALERYGVVELFGDFVTVLDPFPPKPAPDAILSIIKRNNLDPATSLMLGDRDIDVLAARNAGIMGALFDPEHFYDGFENELRSNSVAELRKVLGL